MSRRYDFHDRRRGCGIDEPARHSQTFSALPNGAPGRLTAGTVRNGPLPPCATSRCSRVPSRPSEIERGRAIGARPRRTAQRCVVAGAPGVSPSVGFYDYASACGKRPDVRLLAFTDGIRDVDAADQQRWSPRSSIAHRGHIGGQNAERPIPATHLSRCAAMRHSTVGPVVDDVREAGAAAASACCRRHDNARSRPPSAATTRSSGDRPRNGVTTLSNRIRRAAPAARTTYAGRRVLACCVRSS